MVGVGAGVRLKHRQPADPGDARVIVTIPRGMVIAAPNNNQRHNNQERVNFSQLS